MTYNQIKQLKPGDEIYTTRIPTRHAGGARCALGKGWHGGPGLWRATVVRVPNLKKIADESEIFSIEWNGNRPWEFTRLELQSANWRRNPPRNRG
jgi:hypothetical protein